MAEDHREQKGVELEIIRQDLTQIWSQLKDLKKNKKVEQDQTMFAIQVLTQDISDKLDMIHKEHRLVKKL